MKLSVHKILLLLVFLAAGVLRISAQSKLLDSLALDSLPAILSLEEAKKDPDHVIKLALRREHLKEFPPEIFLFKNLQFLDLSRNNIKELPDSIGNLKNLQVLHLSRNDLESLPPSIGNLSHLRVLEVNQNNLSSLPPAIGRLKSLVYMDLWSNNLNRFPDEIRDIKDNLKIVDLRVILINDAMQKHIQALLPNTTIYFSPPCHCGQ